jgi:hypothetical protein
MRLRTFHNIRRVIPDNRTKVEKALATIRGGARSKKPVKLAPLKFIEKDDKRA